MIFTLIILLFRSFVVAASIKEFLCNTQTTLGHLDCKIEFLYSEENAVAECINWGDRNTNMAVTIGLHVHFESLFNVSFTCTSNHYLGVSEIRFKDRDPKAQFTNIRLEHRGPKVVLNIALPSDPFFVFNEGELVEYTIFGIENPMEKLKVTVEFHKIINDRNCMDAKGWYNLQGEYPVDVSQEIVTIPVVTFCNEEIITSVQTRQGDFRVDGFHVSYSPMEGVRINTSYVLFSEDDILWLVHEDSFSSVEVFRVSGADRNFFPQKNLQLYGAKFNNILEKATRPKTENSVVVSCSTLADVAEDEDIIIISPFYPNVKIIPTNYSLGEYQHKRFYATAEIPYMSREELLNATESGAGDFICEFPCVFFACTSLQNPYDWSYYWSVFYDADSPQFYYSLEHSAFVCEGFALMDGDFISRNSPVLTHWTCNNPFECQTVSTYCLEDARNANWRMQSQEATNNCMRGMQTSSVPCSSLGESDHRFDSINCETIIPAKKGIVQCLTFYAHHELGTEYRRVYFEGFNGIVYVETGEEPPLEAKLKLSSLYNETNYFYTKEYFKFRCEGHSFFYSGLKWFFKYNNGSVLPPPTEFAEHLNVLPQDRSNPELNVAFRFEDTDVVQIICSALLLNSKEWENVTIDVLVYVSTLPSIAYSESEPVFFLRENISDQMLSCPVTGIPLPNVTWTRFDQDIQDPLKILSGGVLLFPGYNNSLLGRYTCHAKSVSGSISKNFLVQKLERITESSAEQSNTNYIYYVTGAITLLLTIVALLTFRYLRSDKMLRYREMKDVLILLEGVTEKSKRDDKNLEPVNVPFNHKYEIQKDSFIIDRKVLLGKGEFSEVYKGHINGVDNPVAFKSPKEGSPVLYLKALVSELKILMYIGEHENLVVLLGAYTKEIRKGLLKDGVLFMAVELCPRGSLEIFLRKNKHSFLASFKSYNQDNADEMESDDDNAEADRLCSFQSLLNWSVQIARGMTYLVEKRVIHSDLAARNVLLTAKGIAKVTDFGLSRQIYNYTSEYVKKGSEPLPWKWLAPECLQSQTFSTKSDVWAYGITLFEIFSLGDLPYPCTTLSAEFVENLITGTRPSQPKYSTKELYDLMCTCWVYEASKRPNFQLLISLMEAINCGENGKRNKIYNAITGYVQLSY